MEETEYTLIFLTNDSKVLLGLKKRGLGKGKWNGFGGKLKRGENKYDCAVREFHEESNIIIKKSALNYIGVVNYEDIERRFCRKVYIFTVNQFEGKEEESEEMKPEWFDISKIPYREMWPDSKFWVPFILTSNKKITASFTYKNNNDLVNKMIDIS